MGKGSRPERLHWWILLGMLLGVAWGSGMHSAYHARFQAEARLEILGPSPTAAQEVAATKNLEEAIDRRLKGTLAGGVAYGLAKIFMGLLKMVVIPLVFASLICGITGMGDFKRLGRVGGSTALWYLVTTALAIVTGLVLVNLIGPGQGVELPVPVEAAPLHLPDSAWDMVSAMVPSNLVAAAAGDDLLPVIFFAILFGVFLLKSVGEGAKKVEAFFQGVFEVMMHMTHFVIRLAPIGIAALIAKLLAATGLEVFSTLAAYFGTVALALSIHFFGLLPLLFWVRTRRNPYKVMRAMSPALLTAFSTASSSGTLPVTLDRVEHHVGVGNQVSSFVLPLGATVNMDGTALYECVATLFVAQMYAGMNPDFSLTFGTQLTIVGLALLVSVGAAGIPHAGLVMMAVIFKAIGLPLELMGLLWAVDRPLDMFRTATNVWSDTLGTIFVAHRVGEIDEGVLFGRPGP